MSEAKRYEVRQSERADGCEVTEPGGRVMARTLEPWQADRIARLLNAEAEVRAALRAIVTCEDSGTLDDAYYAEHDAAMAKVRSALSALGESPDAEAVRP